MTGRKTRNSAKAMVSETLDSLENISELSADGRLIVSAIADKIDELREEFSAKLAEKDAKIDALEAEDRVLKSNISKIEEKVEDADAYERKNTLVISGSGVPAVLAGENGVHVVCKLLKDVLKLEVPLSSISDAHRIGKKPINQQVDSRNILFQLARRDLKSDILKACKTVKPVSMFINENLTPTRSTIMYVLRRAKRQFPEKISGSSSRDGKVFVWLKPPNANAPDSKNTKMAINSYHRLDEFCTKSLLTPITTYIDSWPH